MLEAKAKEIARDLDAIAKRSATASNPQAELDRRYIDENWYRLNKTEAEQVKRYLKVFPG